MRLFFDTSALVPVFQSDHIHHRSSTAVFRAAGRDDCCALRTLAEVYATLTGLPVRPRVTGPGAIAILKQIRERLTLVSLSDEEFISVLETSPNVTGNTTYDALIARCAVKAGADALVTWNVRHFTLLGPAVARMVRTPEQLTGLGRLV